MKESNHEILSILAGIAGVVLAWLIIKPSGFWSFILFLIVGGWIYGILKFILKVIFKS